MSIAQSLLPEFDMETATTRTVVSRVTDAILDYRPHAKSFDTRNLTTHVVNIPGWLTMTLATDHFDFAPPGAPPYTEEPVASVAEALAKFDANVAAAREALAAATDECFMGNWQLLAGGQVMFEMPRIACVRGFIMNHLIHHRAQLCLYLRLNDLPVPSVYGPSADEGQM